MRIITMSDRAHHFEAVNARVELFCEDKTKKIVELKPFVTDSRYMIVIIYEDVAVKKKKA